MQTELTAQLGPRWAATAEPGEEIELDRRQQHLRGLEGEDGRADRAGIERLRWIGYFELDGQVVDAVVGGA